jgi:HlyD family secretion protein
MPCFALEKTQIITIYNIVYKVTHLLRSSLALAVFVTLSPVFAQVKKEAPLPIISVSSPLKKMMKDQFVFSGTFVAKDEVFIFPEVDGLRVTTLLVEEGDKVIKGQPLVRLNSEAVEIALQQNAAALNKANSALESAKTQVPQAEAALKEATNNYDRAKILLDKKDISPAVFDQRVSAKVAAQSRFDAAKDGINLAQADIATAIAQKSDLELRLSRADIKAPVNGVISRRSVKLGQLVSMQSTEPLFRLIGENKIELEGEVLENRLTKLKVGQKAIVNYDTLEVMGEVRLIPSEVDRTTRLGRIRVALEPNAALKVGVFGRGVVTLQEREGLAIPLSSVLYGEKGQTSVQIVQDNKVDTRIVKLGINQEGLVEVLEGLNNKDQVITRAGPFLRSGDRVKIVIEGAK